MEYSRIKNIIIVILLAVNMFFLVLFLIGRTESGKLEKQAKENIAGLYSSAGITLDISKIPPDSKLSDFKLTRDPKAEEAVANAILGTKDLVLTTTGGNTNQYKNIIGEASFRQNGDFEVSFAAPSDGTSYGKAFSSASESALVSYLKGLSIAVDENSAVTEETNGKKTVVFNCNYNKTTIYNSQITMTFYNSNLVSVSGRRLTSTPQPTDSTIMGVNTALIYFLNGIKSIDPACNKIECISAGYAISDSGSGSLDLLPVWRFDTNSETYYVNGLADKISATFN